MDPGNEQSAWIIYDPVNKVPVRFGLEPNEDVLYRIHNRELSMTATHLDCEMIASYGMPVGSTVFDTCVWIGRFIESWLSCAEHATFTQIYRKDVKMHLCGQTRAKDSNIRQAIMDRYGSTRQAAIGTKKNPGPLYGFKKDIWAAMGVAITGAEYEADAT